MLWISGLLLAGAALTWGQALSSGNGVDVMEGQDAVLRCRFDPAQARGDGVSFTWSHKNIRGWDTVAIQSDLFRKGYSVDSRPDEGRYDLHISAATYDQDNGQFDCKVRRVGTGGDIHTESVTLTVLMPPNPPVIELEVPGALTEGQPAPLVCTSTGGSPPPEIRWYRAGAAAPLPGQLTPADDRSRPTVSRLLLQPTRDDDGQRLECVVHNRAMADGARLTATVRLDVNYYPRITVGPDNPLQVELGRSARLQCTVDAKPAVANVRWIRNNAFVGTNQALSIDAVGRDDAGVYTCSARNAVSERKAELRLDVLFAPRVSVEREREVPDGGSVQVVCEVDANPSADEVFWRREGEPDFHAAGATLRLSRVTAADNGRYMCVAVNHVRSVGMPEAERRVGNATTSILIRHAPGRAFITPAAPVGVEGGSLTLTCGARPPGHPTPKYRWSRAGRADAPPLGFGANFTIDHVQTRHAGRYTCQPENELGAGSAATVEVRVFRAPEFGTRMPAEETRPAATAAFEAACSAEGRPKPSVAWLKDGVEVGTADGMYDVTIDESELNDLAFTVRSRLRFRGRARESDRLTPADRGNYTCRFQNDAGTAESTMLLRIRHAPIVYHQYNKVAFDEGEPAVVACQMQAYPAPTFRWSRQGAPLAADPTGFYGVNATELGNDVHQSTLRLARVRPEDYGEYVCHAQNEEGEHSTSLRLQAKSRPEPPTDVHAVELGTDWALLDWTPGFDGGFSGLLHHLSLLGERGNERAFDCQTRRPCNVTSLQHRTTYRVRIQANNDKGDSEYSQQTQFTTLLDVGQLPLPQSAKFERQSRQVNFHVVGSAIDVVGMLDVRSEDADWRPTGQQVPISNNLGVTEVAAALGDVTDVRVRLCLRGNTTVCGAPVLAEHAPAGSMLAPADGISLTAIIIIVVVVIALLAMLVPVLVCCCRRNKAAKKTNKNFNDDAYGRQKLPAYYPPGGGPDAKPGADSTHLGQLNQDPNKVIYGSRPGYEHGVATDHGPASGQQPPNGAINLAYMENSYSNSNNGGSVNSQDSLWQVKAGGGGGGGAGAGAGGGGAGGGGAGGGGDNRSYGNPDNRSYGNPDTRSYGNPDNRSYGNPDTRSYGNPDTRSYGHPEGRPFAYDPNNYDPAQANYLPDQPLHGGYGDYGHYPPQQQQQPYPADAAYPAQDEYGRPYEADPYGAAGSRTPRPHHADGAYRDVSGLPDPYAGQEVDNKPQISFDESLESGYSTPNSRNRRVIREIIV